MPKKIKKQLDFGPIISLTITLVIVIVLSFIFSKLNLDTTKSEAAIDAITTTNVSVKNILSIEGIKYLFASFVNNFKEYNIIYIFIISLLGIGFADNVGLFKRIFKNFKKLKLSFLIVLTLILGCLFGKLGSYSYAFLLPLAACIYKNLGKNPTIGLITMFIALTVGNATSLFPTYLSEALGSITQLSAVAVDKDYVFTTTSTIYITISSFVLFVFIGKLIIEKYLVNKLSKVKYEEVEELELKEKGLKGANIAFIIICVLVAYSIIPGLPLSGMLLGEGTTYLTKLLGNGSPFSESYVLILSLTLIICGTVYGIKSKRIKNCEQFTRMFSGSFNGTAITFVIMAILATIMAVIKWTNIDVFITSVLINFLSSLGITGLGLIIIYFLIIILTGVVMPDTFAKWQIVAPVAVPLIMRANLSASYAQFIYTAADGIGMGISMFFPYVAILFGLMYKYTDTGNFGFIKFYKMLSPMIILFTIVWIIIIITWFVVGIPMGIGVLPSL